MKYKRRVIKKYFNSFGKRVSARRAKRVGSVTDSYILFQEGGCEHPEPIRWTHKGGYQWAWKWDLQPKKKYRIFKIGEGAFSMITAAEEQSLPWWLHDGIYFNRRYNQYQRMGKSVYPRVTTETMLEEDDTETDEYF